MASFAGLVAESVMFMEDAKKRTHTGNAFGC
jgi:hypothetical protein